MAVGAALGSGSGGSGGDATAGEYQPKDKACQPRGVPHCCFLNHCMRFVWGTLQRCEIHLYEVVIHPFPLYFQCSGCVFCTFFGGAASLPIDSRLYSSECEGSVHTALAESCHRAWHHILCRKTRAPPSLSLSLSLSWSWSWSWLWSANRLPRPRRGKSPLPRSSGRSWMRWRGVNRAGTHLPGSATRPCSSHQPE
jgi:hypothetical protein